VGTTNVGFRAPTCLTFYCGAAREGAHCHTRQARLIRARLGSGNRSGDPSGDHIPNIDCSRDARFDVDFGPDVAFLWDPGSLESLQSIGFANFHLAYPHKLYVDKFESKFWDPGLADRPRFID
jgi:hypothetical protein